jgi:3-hydroxyisobutyrate dehydrogenase
VESIAFYGTGMLGSAMIRAMLRRGHSVRVWNRTIDRARPLEKDGAQVFADPAETANGAQRVHCCLSDDASVDAVLDAALPGIAAETPIVDHTTVSPQRVAERVQRLAAADRQLLHAPVFMGPPMALESTGVMLSSGDETLFARVEPALRAMCSDLRYLGARSDVAAIYKLMGNAMILAVVGGINDIFRIAEQQGLSREEAYTLFDFYDPTGQIRGRGKRMVTGDFSPMWSVDMAHKDAVLMQGAAHHEKLPVVDAMEGLMRTISARGLGDCDLGAVAARS